MAEHPTDLQLRFDYGRALLDAGDYEKAIPELQQAVKDPRHKAAACVALGQAFRGQCLAELARGQFEKALEAADPGSELAKSALYELGGVAEDIGRVEDALRHYSRILEQDYGFRDAADRVARLQSASS